MYSRCIAELPSRLSSPLIPQAPTLGSLGVPGSHLCQVTFCSSLSTAPPPSPPSLCPPCSRILELFHRLLHYFILFCALTPPCDAVLAPWPGTCGLPGPGGWALQSHPLLWHSADTSGPLLWLFSTSHLCRRTSNSSSLSLKPVPIWHLHIPP